MISKEQKLQKSFREHVEVIIRRRWFLVIPFISILLLAVVASFFVPSIYEATAVIQINDKKLIDPLVQGLAVSPRIKEQVDAMTKQVLSYPRMTQIVDRYRLAGKKKGNNALEPLILSLRERITVEVKDKDIIQIAFKDPDPLTAQNVTNAITQNFIYESSRSNREEARNAIEFLNEQLKIYRQKLEESERNFSTRKVTADLRVAQNRKKLLESRMANINKIVPSEVKSEQNAVVARLQGRLAELEMELSRLMIDAKEEHPRVVGLKNEISKIKGRLDSEIKKETVRESISISNPQYQQTEQELRQLDMEIGYLEKRRQELGAEETDENAVSDEEMAALETGKRVDEDIYQSLLRQIESAYVSERLQDSDKGAIFSVIEYARLPLVPSANNKLKVLLGGLFLGLVGGLGGVYAMEYLDRSFRTADDAKKILKMQFLGSVSRIVTVTENNKLSLADRMNERIKRYIQRHKLFSEIRFVSPHIARPVVSSGISPQLVIHHEPKSAVAEEYRIIRTNIQSLGYESALHTVMLTSAVRGEGKSTTTSNLAVSLADSGKNVVLVDCDLRRGVVHELLNLAQSPGLTDILAKGMSIEAALVQTRIKNLSAITCGNRPLNPSELLGTKLMETLLESLKARFDIVVIDAPPVLNLPDSCILGRYADGVIMVVQAERTQREDILHAQAMLAQSHGNITGFVMTNVQYYIPKYVYNYLYGT
jgi:tyrosine-protein kinase Etk/Wzc